MSTDKPPTPRPAPPPPLTDDSSDAGTIAIVATVVIAGATACTVAILFMQIILGRAP